MESRDNNRGLSNLDDIKKNYPIRMILTKVTSKKLKEIFFKIEKSPYCRFGTPNLPKMA